MYERRKVFGVCSCLFCVMFAKYVGGPLEMLDTSPQRLGISLKTCTSAEGRPYKILINLRT